MTERRHTASMTRTFSTITWGIALLFASVVLANSHSLPWTLAAAGAVPTVAGLIKAMIESSAADKAKDAEQRAAIAATRARVDEA